MPKSRGMIYAEFLTQVGVGGVFEFWGVYQREARGEVILLVTQGHVITRNKSRRREKLSSRREISNLEAYKMANNTFILQLGWLDSS